MKRFQTILRHGHQLIDRQSFDAEVDARRHYRQTELPYPLVLELWKYHPPVNVVMGHRISIGWQKLAEKTGVEEFC